MRRQLHQTLLAAIIGGGIVAGGAWAGAAEQDRTATPAVQPTDRNVDVTGDRGTSGTLALPAGFVAKDLNEADDIRSELANLTEDAVQRQHFDNLVRHLVDEDRNRLKEDKDRDVAALNDKVDQFRKAWRDKYGQDFDVDHKRVFTDSFAIATGEVSDSKVAVANWPLPATREMAGAAPGEAVPAAQRENEKLFGGSKNLDKGRNVALVRIPDSHGLPEMTVSMIHELPDQWRLDIPNSRSGQQIYDDLLRHVGDLTASSSQWPADIDDAYRMVTHHTVAALYGVQGMQGQTDRALPDRR